MDVIDNRTCYAALWTVVFKYHFLFFTSQRMRPKLARHPKSQPFVALMVALSGVQYGRLAR